MESSPKLYRRRYFPNEQIHLKDDVILKRTADLIVTRWNTLKPRADISRGLSAYFLNEGYKISKIYNHDGVLVYWYCDIIETRFDAEENSYTFNDLLIDIIVEPDRTVRVVDLDELGDLLERGSIALGQCAKALKTADVLLSKIYQNEFYKLQNVIEDLE